MTMVFLYVTMSTALYYLAGRAKITHFLWSRYPPQIEYWALCAACSGAAYGTALWAGFGLGLELPLLGLPGRAWYTALAAVGLCMVWTPILGWIMVKTWMELATTDEDEDEPANVTPISPRRK